MRHKNLNKSSTPRNTYAAAPITITLLLAFCACLTSCKRQPPLPPDLAAISCPPENAEHVSTKFAKAEVTFLCVPKHIVDRPELLRCEDGKRPYCEDSGMITLSRLPRTNKIVSGAPFNARGYEPGPITDPETDKGSLLEVSFYDKAPGKKTYKVGPRQYLRETDKQRVPSGFTLVNGPLCDRVSNALDRGTCQLELKSASLNWYINVSMPRPRGNDIDDSLYDKDMQMWLDLLGKMVVDPKV